MAYGAYGASDPGKAQTINEDMFLAFVHQDVLFMVVADGFGARSGREIASAVAIREARLFLERYVPGSPSPGVLQHVMEQALFVANRAIRSFLVAHPEWYDGWGASMTMAAINRQYTVVWVHIGHTRASILRGQEWMRLTKDHTEAQADLDAGRIREDEWWSHPGRALLTRGLGMTDRILADGGVYQGIKGDILLLSTDGLHGVLPPVTQSQVIYRAGTTQEAMNQLVRAVLERGAPDNVAGVITYLDYGF